MISFQYSSLELKPDSPHRRGPFSITTSFPDTNRHIKQILFICYKFRIQDWTIKNVNGYSILHSDWKMISMIKYNMFISEFQSIFNPSGKNKKKLQCSIPVKWQFKTARNRTFHFPTAAIFSKIVVNKIPTLLLVHFWSQLVFENLYVTVTNWSVRQESVLFLEWQTRFTSWFMPLP